MGDTGIFTRRKRSTFDKAFILYLLFHKHSDLLLHMDMELVFFSNQGFSLSRNNISAIHYPKSGDPPTFEH